MTRKQSKTFYFSVEGETEQWYIEWLKGVINNNSHSRFNAKIDCIVQKDPLKRAKNPKLKKTDIFHLCDRESETEEHTTRFSTTLQRMKEANNLGKSIKYKLGYSNFTFELWMILHKAKCNGLKTHRKQYIDEINRVFSEQFRDHDEYKREDNFKRILSKLTLDDVKSAIQYAEQLMQKNSDSGYTLHKEHGFSYYKNNPSLNVHEIINKILKDCGL